MFKVLYNIKNENVCLSVCLSVSVSPSLSLSPISHTLTNTLQTLVIMEISQYMWSLFDLPNDKTKGSWPWLVLSSIGCYWQVPAITNYFNPSNKPLPKKGVYYERVVGIASYLKLPPKSSNHQIMSPSLIVIIIVVWLHDCQNNVWFAGYIVDICNRNHIVKSTMSQYVSVKK